MIEKIWKKNIIFSCRHVILKISKSRIFSQSFAVKNFNRKSNTKIKIYKFIKFINPLSGMSYNIYLHTSIQIKTLGLGIRSSEELRWAPCPPGFYPQRKHCKILTHARTPNTSILNHHTNVRSASHNKSISVTQRGSDDVCYRGISIPPYP